MRKQIAVMVLLISTLTMAAPALGSTTEVTRPATTTISDTSVDDASAQDLRRFCAANPGHDRCDNQPVVNVRQMIWRLIIAGEWRQLFQLLHRLGII